MCYVQAAAWIASAVITAYAGYQQGETQKGIAKYQADVANQNAELDDLRAAQAKNIGSIKEDQHRAKVRQIAGAQRAQFAANGVDLGSGVVEDMLGQTYTMGETDALAIRFEAMNEAWGYQTSATNNRNDARFAKWRGPREAQGTYLTTAANIAGSYGSAFGGGSTSSGGNYGTKTGGNRKG